MSTLTRTRFLLRAAQTLLVGLAVAGSCVGEEMKARQVIIRAPESRVVAAALQNPNDDALAKVLWGWVKEGTASVVSDLTADLSPQGPAKADAGRTAEWATEIEQDFGLETGIARLIPKVSEKVFVGSSFETEISNSMRQGAHTYVESSWRAFFSPCNERLVPWPCWWPETKKTPQVSWYQQTDFFLQEVLTSARFAPGSQIILGIMPRADRLEPGPKRAPTLDVILAQAGPSVGPTPTGPAKDAAPHSPHGRCTVIGFGLKDHEAVAMLGGSTIPHGKALLETLLKKVEGGEATVRLFSSMASFQEHRSSLKSVRQHHFPVEMPTIPSSWERREVGTTLQISAVHHEVQFELEFHPAPPRRAEWRCALETPDLFMWQPQFFVRRVKTSFDFGEDGVALLGAMRTPECQQGGTGIIPGETLMLLAKLDGMTVLPEDQMEPVTKDLPQAPVLECEAVVFDIPASEGVAWKNAIVGVPDEERFGSLLSQSKGPDVKLAAHMALTAAPGQRAGASTVEEVRTVTEVDPPADISPTRYRPTAMEEIHCGTRWEVEAQLLTPDDPFKALGPIEVLVTHTLRHHVAPPLEPNYETMIADSRNNPRNEVPKAMVLDEGWKGQMRLVPGKPFFIGVREPPGDAFRDRLHVAFMRVRVKEGRPGKQASPAAPADPFAPRQAPK